jgi:hypothetical protein
VPNREAGPPRRRRLGWTLFETLPLRISLGLPLSFARGHQYGPATELTRDPVVLSDEFFRPRSGWRQRWTREKLLWRASNPLETIWLHRLGPAAAFVSVRRRSGLPVIAVVVKTFVLPGGGAGSVDLGPLTAAIRAAHKVCAVAYIGRNSDISFPGFNFPERWRPSPLTLGGRAFQNGPFHFDKIDCFEGWDYDLF